MQLDVTSDASVSACVAEIAVRTGDRIDVLVNNAGTGVLAHAEEVSADEAAALFQVNLFGVMRMISAVLPLMRAPGRGRLSIWVRRAALLRCHSLACTAPRNMPWRRTQLLCDMNYGRSAWQLRSWRPVPSARRPVIARHAPQPPSRTTPSAGPGQTFCIQGRSTKAWIHSEWPRPFSGSFEPESYGRGIRLDCSASTGIARSVLPPSAFEAVVKWGLGRVRLEE